MENNKMKEILVDKVVVNMGVGEAGEELKKAVAIMEKITDSKAKQTKCRVKAPTWNVRPGLEIGCMVTLRKEKALDFLKKALQAKNNEIKERSFDKRGNFGFGIKEYIDLPGAKYDPKLGIKGFDVLVALKRRGYPVNRKKIKSKIGLKHVISKEDAIKFITEKFGVAIK